MVRRESARKAGDYDLSLVCPVASWGPTRMGKEVGSALLLGCCLVVLLVGCGSGQKAGVEDEAQGAGEADGPGSGDQGAQVPFVAPPATGGGPVVGLKPLGKRAVAEPNLPAVDPYAVNTTPDMDKDGVEDATDNCPDAWNPDQWDTLADGTGDRCRAQLGTIAAPYIIPGSNPGLPVHRVAGNTCDSQQSEIDSYPPNTRNESGPEHVYALRITDYVDIVAYIASPEPAGTDIDVHILGSIEPIQLVERSDREVKARLAPGLWYIVLDSFNNGEAALCGGYILTVQMMAVREGSPADPLLPSGAGDVPLELPFYMEESRNTQDATSAWLWQYNAPGVRDLSGPEYVYAFTVAQPVRLSAVLQFPEPAGTDVDLLLLSSLDPVTTLTWGDRSVYAQLNPGTYFLVVDTVVSGGTMAGQYKLQLSVRPTFVYDSIYFNDYILAAVDYLYAIHGLQGYGSAVLTHDITYGKYGVIPASAPPRTMCVAAAMEVILKAMKIYSADTGDESVYDFLPIESWKTLKSTHIKAHIWVNSDLQSSGTADALVHFGMGANVPFEELTPGSFLNLNRTTGTGHAVVFIAFIDEMGHEYGFYNYSTIGFKYFSAQGGADVWKGGLDYRYAIFEQFGSPTMPYKRDIHVIYSANQDWLNTGIMYHPELWKTPLPSTTWAPRVGVFNPQEFDGETE